MYLGGNRSWMAPVLIICWFKKRSQEVSNHQFLYHPFDQF